MVGELIYLAIASLFLGGILVFVLIVIVGYLGIDIFEYKWLLVLPVIMAVTINITLIEIFRRRR